MDKLFLLSNRPMARISPHFPLSHGVPRVDDRRVVSGIVYVIRHGLQWKDAPKAYGPHKSLYNRFVRWSLLGVFDRIFASLAAEDAKPDRIMIDATHLKAHRTAASLLQKGAFPAALVERRPVSILSCMRSAMEKASPCFCCSPKARRATTRVPASSSGPCRQPGA